jgi:polysaccharide export outer membrane protein
MLKQLKTALLFIGIALFISSCSTLNKSRMLKTPLNYEFDEVKDSLKNQEYKIAVDDEIQIQMFSNNGYSFIALSQGRQGNNNGGGFNQNQNLNIFKVRVDSTIKVPVIGSIKVVGLNLFELENKIESLLEDQFQNPFVIAKINNRRVFVFRGGNSANVFQLQNQNTTLFEVLAFTGGVPQDGNASRIKVIRGEGENQEIFLIDISRIDGIKDAKMQMQAGDIIYIDPFLNYANFIVQDISAVLSLVSSVLLVYTLVSQ